MKESTTINNASRDDMAFFNSVLSYGIYTDREWMLGLNTFGEKITEKSFEDIVTEAAFELFENDAPPKELMKRNYELYISAYIQHNFVKVSLQQDEEIDFLSTKYGYQTKCQFQESNYFALNNLARAGYFLSQNEDGSQNLHLVFRGTDNKARDFMDFVGKAYLDMSAYYEAFKPLEEKILAFAKDPNNNIKTVHVSGHSLGGAMVQEFFNSPHVKKSGLDLVGFTYGAPGTDKKPIHSIVTESFHTAKNFFKTGKFSAFADLAMNTIAPAFTRLLPNTFALTNFMTTTAIGFNFSDVLPATDPANHKVDDRIFQYEHSGDLIPKLGWAAYNEKGTGIYLKDFASKNAHETFMLTGRKENTAKHKFFTFMSNSFNWLVKKPIQYVKNMFNFEYHDMMRYVVNLEHKISSDYKNNNSPYYTQFTNYKTRFTQHTAITENDLNYSEGFEKNENSSNEKQINYTRISKEAQEEMSIFRSFQTTRNVISDILGKPVSYNQKELHNLKDIQLSGTNTTIDTSIPDLMNGVASDISKTMTSSNNLEQDYSVTFKNTALHIKNMKEMRRKFLEGNKDNTHTLIIS